MAQNYKYYNLVGDDGYGLFTSWDDMQEAAIRLNGSLHFRGFLTAREAYNDILKNVLFRWKIRQVGVIDLATLMKKQFITLNPEAAEADEQEAPATTVGGIHQKAARKGGRVRNRRQGGLAALLAEEEEEDQPAAAQAQSEALDEDELYQLYLLLSKKYNPGGGAEKAKNKK